MVELVVFNVARRMVAAHGMRCAAVRTFQTSTILRKEESDGTGDGHNGAGVDAEDVDLGVLSKESVQAQIEAEREKDPWKDDYEDPDDVWTRDGRLPDIKPRGDQIEEYYNSLPIEVRQRAFEKVQTEYRAHLAEKRDYYVKNKAARAHREVSQHYGFLKSELYGMDNPLDLEEEQEEDALTKRAEREGKEGDHVLGVDQGLNFKERVVRQLQLGTKEGLKALQPEAEHDAVYGLRDPLNRVAKFPASITLRMSEAGTESMTFEHDMGQSSINIERNLRDDGFQTVFHNKMLPYMHHVQHWHVRSHLAPFQQFKDPFVHPREQKGRKWGLVKKKTYHFLGSGNRPLFKPKDEHVVELQVPKGSIDLPLDTDESTRIVFETLADGNFDGETLTIKSDTLPSYALNRSRCHLIYDRLLRQTRKYAKIEAEEYKKLRREIEDADARVVGDLLEFAKKEASA
eukprot:Clim_evm10s48 gene=Clim_evmTU10s48